MTLLGRNQTFSWYVGSPNTNNQSQGHRPKMIKLWLGKIWLDWIKERAKKFWTTVDNHNKALLIDDCVV